MSRPYRARALAVALALGAAACQDYNFNPVGHCLIQPGSKRITLSDVSTADVLFVVDDSGSMASEQQALADNFQDFIDNLTSTNVGRRAAGLQAIDFHIAITTSSIYWNPEKAGQVCSTTCGSAAGKAVCCLGGTTPARRPRACTLGGTECTGITGPNVLAGFGCRLNCGALRGDPVCCNTNGTIPPEALTEVIPCARPGQTCGGLDTHYDFQGCTNTRIAADRTPFPDGDFVSSGHVSDFGGVAATPNPRVLHFDKSLYTPAGATGTNLQGDTTAQLVTWFKQNIQVGTCGSGQEQPLEAGRRAITKAYAGLQKDTRSVTGAPAWTPPSATQRAVGATARWPNEKSKLVVVFVGDEDDCSAPKDPTGGVVMLANQGPGQDACTRDGDDAAPLGQRQFAVSDFVSYFSEATLGRPVAAGFIFPAAEQACTLQSCTAAGVCCPPGGCSLTDGAQAKGTRLLAAARGLSAAGVEVVGGSICDPDFGKILNDIADVVKPPETLALPDEPAEGRITVLRILSGTNVVKTCGQPLGPRVPNNFDLAEARATGADWWFTEKASAGPPAMDPDSASSSGVPFPTKYIYINRAGGCIANAGETYAADYLGVLPPGGCTRSPTDPDGALDCQAKVGGPANSFECYVPPGLSRGTCTCKSVR